MPTYLNTKLSVQIYYLDGAGSTQAGGSTIASRVAALPAANTWWIEPCEKLSERDWSMLLDLVTQLRIPGLGAREQMTDAWLQDVSELDHITYLDLHGCKAITDIGIRCLARLPNLQYLNLSGTEVTDQGLVILRHFPEMRRLELAHQRNVSDAGLNSLAHCNLIECVNLMGTHTGDETIKVLTGKPQLRQFFAGNEVTDEGLRLFESFPMFKTPSPGEPEMSLMSFSVAASYLWLNLNSALSDRGLSYLSTLDGLYALNLMGTTGYSPFDNPDSFITSVGVSGLAKLPGLRWLGCNAGLCTKEVMSRIGELPNLRFLMCQDTIAPDEGFIALSRSPSIEYLWGRRSHNLTGRGFVALAAMPNLSGLSVSCKNINTDALSVLPRFAALKQFMPIDVPDEGFRHVGQCEDLESLECMYCPKMTDAATLHIASLPKLKSYRAWSSQITDESLLILGRINSLERVLLSNCPGVTDAGLAGLAALPKLREVYLEGLSGLTAEGTAVFPRDVRVNYLG